MESVASTLAPGNAEGGVAYRLILDAVEREEGRWGMLGCSFNPVRREDSDIVSVGRDASVCADATDEALDFLMSWGSLKILELLDVEEKTLDVSLTSFDPDRVRLPPGLRNRPAMPEAIELRDCTEGERGTVTTKLEEGRELADSLLLLSLPRAWCRTGTTDSSEGTVELLANLSNRLCRSIRYSSSFSKPSEFATANSFSRCASVTVTLSVAFLVRETAMSLSSFVTFRSGDGAGMLVADFSVEDPGWPYTLFRGRGPVFLCNEAAAAVSVPFVCIGDG